MASQRKQSQHQAWYLQVKKELLMTEPQNIYARANCCQNIVNNCVERLNRSLTLGPLKDCNKYKCIVDSKAHLKFLLDWPGLRVINVPKIPLSKKEYSRKAKNWLNGRRSRNYGRTLFPFFVADIERYVLEIGKLLIESDQARMKLYYNCVIYKILAQLCGCSVSLHEQSKRAPFFCKNSVERKGRLKEILQSYASEHQYIQGFPSCFDEAIGFFDAKSNLFFQEYRKTYLGIASDSDNCTDSSSVSNINNHKMSNKNNNHKIKTHSTNNHHKLMQTTNSVSSQSSSSQQSHIITNHGPFETHNIRNNITNITHSICENIAGNSKATADFWKNEAMKYKIMFEKERQLRLAIEKERDRFKSMALDSKFNIIQTNINNNNTHSTNHNNRSNNNGGHHNMQLNGYNIGDLNMTRNFMNNCAHETKTNAIKRQTMAHINSNHLAAVAQALRVSQNRNNNINNNNMSISSQQLTPQTRILGLTDLNTPMPAPCISNVMQRQNNNNNNNNNNHFMNQSRINDILSLAANNPTLDSLLMYDRNVQPLSSLYDNHYSLN